MREYEKYLSITYLIGFLSSLISAVAISSISRIPLRHIFSIILAIISFLIYILLLSDKNVKIKIKFLKGKFTTSTNIFQEIYAPIVYIISIVFVIINPPIEGVQFMNWLHIPAANYLRLFAGILLSSMLPGYGLLRLLDREKRYVGLDSLIFSFFISVFLMSLIAYVLMVSNIPIVYNYWATLIFNIVVFGLFSYSTLKKRKTHVIQKRKETHSNYNKLDYLILGGIFAFYVAGWFVYYSSYTLGSPGDMWTHYGEFMQLMKGLKLFSSPHLAYLGAESWFSLHYISLAQLGGFPTVNGWMVYAFINFFYILSFYQMVRGIVGENHPKVPAIATVIATTFRGFGWVKALSLASSPGTTWGSAISTAGTLTYNDIIFSFLYGPIPQYLSLAMMCSLIYLMVRKGEFNRTSIFLTVVLVSQSYLVHIPEITLFFIFYYCFLFFVKSGNLGRLKRYSFSILLGLLFIFLIGLPFPSHFYFDIKLPLILTTFLIGLTLILIQFRSKIRFSLTFPRKLVFILVFAVWLFYGLSFFAWQSTLDLDITQNLVYVGLMPWYMYGMHEGISLLLALLGLTFLIVNNKAELTNSRFLVSSLIMFFIAGKILSYVNINIMATGYWEKRFISFIIIPVSILGAFFLDEVFPKFSHQSLNNDLRIYPAKLAITGFFMSLIVVSGVSSHILALDLISLNSKGSPYAGCSDAEMAALEFLKVNATTDTTVLGGSTRSNRFAYVFSGMNHLKSPYWFTKNSPFQFIDIESPELALKAFYSLNITYLYVTQEDMEGLHSNGYAVNHLLNYLPIAFHNDEVTIYKLPKLQPPSSSSNFTIAVPSYMFPAISDPNVLIQKLPRQTLFNETFMQYEEGSDGTPSWDPINETWGVVNGVYKGTGKEWVIRPSVISDLNLSDFSFQTCFKIGTGYYAGIIFRYVNPSNFYCVLISEDGRYNDMYKMVDGKLHLIAHSTSQPVGNEWNALQVHAYGIQFSVYLNGEKIMSTSDQQFSSGKVGLLVDFSTSYFDNVTVESLPDIREFMDSTFYLPLDMLAQSNLQYSIQTIEDGAQFNSQYILLPSDQGLSCKKMSDYLTWVKEGGHLIVLNGGGFGSFAEILSIKGNYTTQTVIKKIVSEINTLKITSMINSILYSDDEKVKVIANYVGTNNRLIPFAFKKRVGDGEIIYLNISPIFKTLSSKYDNQKSEIFLKLGDLILLLNLNAPKKELAIGDNRVKYLSYDTTLIRDYANFKGSVQIESNSILIPHAQFNVSNLKFINVSGTINGSYLKSISEYDMVLISNFTIYEASNNKIIAKDVYIIPTNWGNYAYLLLKNGFNYTIQLRSGGCNFNLKLKNNSYDVKIYSGTIIMENIYSPTLENLDHIFNTTSNTTSILSYNPFIIIKGNTFISEAYIPNYINYVSGQPVNIEGITKFSFDSSCQDVILLNDFDYYGVFKSEQDIAKPSMIYWEIFVIPWINVLSSPLFQIFFIIILIIMIIINLI